MKLLKLVLAQIAQQKLAHTLSVLLVSIGVVFAWFALTAPTYIKDLTLNKINGIDLIVGAKGSLLQLVLANAFHIDQPTGNIDYEQAIKLTRNPQIKQAVPLAYGDYFKQYRILGTDSTFREFYGLALKEGEWNLDINEVIISETLAEQQNFQLGDVFHGSHGDMNGQPHEDDYRIVGIFKKNNSVADQLIITSIASIWHAHHSDKKEITAMLLSCKTPMAKLTLPNYINKQTPFLAAIPTIEINRLLGFMENGFIVIQLLGWLLIAFAGLSLFFNLMNSMDKRKFDLGLFRIMGASPLQCALLVVLESLLVVMLGLFLGILLAIVLPIMMNIYLPVNMQIELTTLSSTDLLILLPTLFTITLVASIIPAIKAYKTPLTTLLNHA